MKIFFIIWGMILLCCCKTKFKPTAGILKKIPNFECYTIITIDNVDYAPVNLPTSYKLLQKTSITFNYQLINDSLSCKNIGLGIKKKWRAIKLTTIYE
jgi:hypothetical protein